MPRTRKAKAAVAQTTAQALASLLKSARDIMRKDKGLNGDLDRLPLLTWIMFLKFLDDLEAQREEEAALAGERFRPAVEVPYRGPVEATLMDVLGGLRSACTYVGASKLRELSKRTTFIRVSQQLNTVFGNG